MIARQVFAALSFAILSSSAAMAEDDARTKQLRLLCAQLSGDLTEPGGLAAFRRCLSQDPTSAMRQNAFGTLQTGAAIAPPQGFGRDSRTMIANAVTKFQAADRNSLYVLAADGKLWHATQEGKDAKVVAPDVAAFHALDGGIFYILDAGAKLWRATNDAASRRFVDAEVVQFQPLDGTMVYVLGRDAKLWREKGDMHDRSLVDTEVAAFQAIDAAIVFVKGRDGKLWRENGTRSDRTLVASDVADFRVIGGTVYILTGADNTLWRKTGDSTPEQVASTVNAFQPLDSRHVYALVSNGSLWLGEGMNGANQLVDTDLLVEPGTKSFQAVDAEHVFVLGNDHRLWAEKMPPRR